MKNFNRLSRAEMKDVTGGMLWPPVTYYCSNGGTFVQLGPCNCGTSNPCDGAFGSGSLQSCNDPQNISSCGFA